MRVRESESWFLFGCLILRTEEQSQQSQLQLIEREDIDDEEDLFESIDKRMRDQYSFQHFPSSILRCSMTEFILNVHSLTKESSSAFWNYVYSHRWQMKACSYHLSCLVFTTCGYCNLNFIRSLHDHLSEWSRTCFKHQHIARIWIWESASLSSQYIFWWCPRQSVFRKYVSVNIVLDPLAVNFMFGFWNCNFYLTYHRYACNFHLYWDKWSRSM